jgi:hypothetical protein
MVGVIVAYTKPLSYMAEFAAPHGAAEAFWTFRPATHAIVMGLTYPLGIMGVGAGAHAAHAPRRDTRGPGTHSGSAGMSVAFPAGIMRPAHPPGIVGPPTLLDTTLRLQRKCLAHFPSVSSGLASVKDACF